MYLEKESHERVMVCQLDRGLTGVASASHLVNDFRVSLGGSLSQVTRAF